MGMSKYIAVLAPMTLVFALCAFSPSKQEAAKDQAGIPGITGKDPFPNGCVSCHVKTDEGDYRLPAVLKSVKDHPDVSGMVKNVPADCGMCHKAGPTPPSFKVALHKVHYGKKEDSQFVKKFQGACLNCHALDVKTGKMTVKSGPKNW